MSVAKPTPAQLEHWEKRLREYGLGMDRGRTNKLSYGWEYRDFDDSFHPKADIRGNPSDTPLRSPDDFS